MFKDSNERKKKKKDWGKGYDVREISQEYREGFTGLNWNHQLLRKCLPEARWYLMNRIPIHKKSVGRLCQAPVSWRRRQRHWLGEESIKKKNHLSAQLPLHFTGNISSCHEKSLGSQIRTSFLAVNLELKESLTPPFFLSWVIPIKQTGDGQLTNLVTGTGVNPCGNPRLPAPSYTFCSWKLAVWLQFCQ